MMTALNEKIAQAEARIKELELLITEWKKQLETEEKL